MKQAAYLQLYRKLREDIESGRYTHGDRLPGKRALAESAGVSVITAEHAYALLAEEGYVEPRERSGYYVCYRAADFGDMAERPVPVAAHHAHIGGDAFPFSVLARTMRRVLQDYGERILVKSPNHGCPELRRAIADYLGRSAGMQVRQEQIIIGSGAEYLYSLIAQFFAGRVFALENPSYDKIRRVYQALGVPIRLLPMGAQGIGTDALVSTDATVLHVTPFHSFPSGITATAGKRREYADWARRRDGYIIEDNYDAELTPSPKHEDTVFSLCDRRVIYLNTFSATLAPSVRVGYMVLPEELMQPFEKTLGFYSCTVPVFEQYVLAELLDSGDFQRHIHRVRRKRRKSL